MKCINCGKPIETFTTLHQNTAWRHTNSGKVWCVINRRAEPDLRDQTEAWDLPTEEERN